MIGREIVLTLTMLLLLSPLPQVAQAKAKKATTQPKSQKTDHSSKLGTDFSFGDALVNGKYQSANEGTVTVEDDKTLVDLLGVRKHFKDRLATDTTRN